MQFKQSFNEWNLNKNWGIIQIHGISPFSENEKTKIVKKNL